MVFWAMSLITWVILTVFTDLDQINGNVVTAMSLVVGLLSTVIGFYNYQRRLDQREQDNVDDSMGSD
jgi:prepilin signal peptidase PulO-like enzyme (type II secretory pathway)